MVFLRVVVLLLFLRIAILPLSFVIRKYIHLFSERLKQIVTTTSDLLLMLLGSIFLHPFALHRPVRLVFYGLGFFCIALALSYLYRLLFGLALLTKKERAFADRRGIFFFLFTWILLGIIALLQFHGPVPIKELTIHSSKVSESFSFVFFSDTQFGSTTTHHLRRIVTRINDLDADFILFGGDRVDIDKYDASDFSILESLSAPLYRVTGNHEYYHDVQKISGILGSITGTILLDSEKIPFNDYVELIGMDYEDADEKALFLESLDILSPSENRFSIFFMHEPKRVKETASFGFDVQLYGHTHGGQIFPGILFVKLLYGKYGRGLHRLNTTTVYTTQGVGLRGPNMRLGTRNEIVHVKVVKQ